MGTVKEISRIEGAVFDLDGVLADTEPLHIKQWAATMEHYGVFLSGEWFYGFMGLPDKRTAEDLAGKFRLPVTWQELLEEKRENAVRAAEKETDVYPGIAEGLERIKALPLTVATSSCKKVAEAILKAAGLRDFFQAVVTSDDVEKTKPAPECYLKACGLMGKNPSSCVAVEDSPAGAAAAMDAGLFTIGVCTSYSRDKMSGADIVVKKPSDALDWIIERIN